MKSLKKCKGINKAFGFGSCGKMVPAQSRIYGLCRECYKKWYFETEEGKAKQERNRIKPKTSSSNKEAEGLEKDQNWAKKLQDKINEIVRLIDKDKRPFGSMPSEVIHAGHIYSRGAESHLKFHLHNIHSQFGLSNTAQDDDINLRSDLVQMYGESYFEYINSLRSLPCLNYSNIEYEGFYRKACKIANRLKKESRVFGRKDRIRMRNNINLELNIYSFNHCQFPHFKIPSYESIH